MANDDDVNVNLFFSHVECLDIDLELEQMQSILRANRSSILNILG